MRPVLLAVSLSAMFAVGSLTAQTTNSIRYPQSFTGGSTGQIIPLGVLPSSGNFDEGRWQQIVPAHYLPSTGGLILGMEVLSQQPLTMTYNRLAITMSMVPAGGALSNVFANNLPAPVPVYAHQAVSITWGYQVWQVIPFDIPFFYDGVSDIVIDIQKVFDRVATPPSILSHHQTDGDPGRTDLPIARDAFGAFGSGASTAAVATSSSGVSLKVGFQFADLPTFTLNGPTSAPSFHVFPIGGSFTATLNGFAGMPYGSLLSFGWATTPLTVPGIGGNLVLDFATLLAYDSGTLGSSGQASITFAIPSSAALVGAHVMFQGVSLNATAALVLTNGIDCVINS